MPVEKALSIMSVGEMMRKKFKESKRFRIIAVVFATFVLVAGFSLAWFMINSGNISQLFGLSSFDAKPDCYFMVEGSRVETSSYMDSFSAIKLSIKPEDANYIGNFRVDVKYKGRGSGYLRVKMAHQFKTGAGASQYTINVPYLLSSQYDDTNETTDQNAWYDNRGTDYCYYYANAIKASGNTEYETLNLITGIDTDSSHDNYLDIDDFADDVEISVAVETDMVQINRYPQRWGMDLLPWVE